MNDKQLRLQVVFAALDKLTAPLKKIMGESNALGKAIKANNDRLKELNSLQKDVGRFRELNAGLRDSSSKLRDTQQQIAALAQKMQQTTQPTRAMTREFDAAVKSAGALKRAGLQQSEQLQVLRERLSGAGIGTDRLSKHERSLRGDIAAANVQLAEQQKRLAAIAGHQQKITASRQHADKMRTTAGNVASAGVGATVAGGAVGAPLVAGLHEAKQYQQEVSQFRSLGIGEDKLKEAIAFSKNMRIKGSSEQDNLKMLKEAYSITRDMHHAEEITPLLAKMKFGIESVMMKGGRGEGHGEMAENMFIDLIKTAELRGSLKDMESFKNAVNMATQTYVASGGLVKPEELLNTIKTGGIAAKQLNDQSFYFGLLHSIQETGGFRSGTGLMSAYTNWAQGRTTQQSAEELVSLGIIKKESVQYGKTGHVKKILPNAMQQADKYKTDPFAFLLEDIVPKIKAEGKHTDSEIVSRIGELFSSRKGGDLFASMYLERENIKKHMGAAPKAFNVEKLYDEAGKNVTGQENDATAKLANLKLAMGERILPLYSRAIDTLTIALEGLNGFMERNPATAKAMIVGFGSVAAILIVLGPLMLGLAALIGPYAMLHVLFAKMGIAGGVLTPVLRGLGSAFTWLGRILLFVGRAFLMNPIGLAVTAIGVAAYLIYQYWGPIKDFFVSLWDGVGSVFTAAWASIKAFAGGLWSDVKTAFGGGIGSVNALVLNWSPLGLFYQAFAGVMNWFGMELPSKFSEFGLNIMQGLANGITGALGTVKAAVTGAGDNVVGWFKDKLGIHSPSRVFAELGDFTMQGLSVGLQRSQDDPLGQVNSLAKRLTQLGAGIAIGAAAMPALAFDTRPPIAPRAPGAGMVIQGDTIQITVTAAPGMDEQAIARAVAQAMEQRDRQKAVRMRSSLSDYDY
ncbi:phage tail tape measure protein [Collimonas sp. NPDC087041]|uniref:phage tail tape measure protein n=1 Tax=Collimonas sp. NPDC087041 TaxID=3363960 RepID=UPI0038106BD2